MHQKFKSQNDMQWIISIKRGYSGPAADPPANFNETQIIINPILTEK
jgi:hypothetical protein